MESAQDGAGVRFPPPLIYIIGLVTGIYAGRALNLRHLGLNHTIRDILGGAFLVAGVVAMFAGAGLLRSRKTNIIPFKPATCLVDTGIYRITRNPMYLGMALTYLALANLFDSLGALALLPVVIAVMQTQVIAREEAYLERAFGGAYLAYKGRVRRWI
jgi:protein-S-isoprenylcysteine O-methyltransferase Ste14